MSHSFPSLQPHPTLTPNPTFQPTQSSSSSPPSSPIQAPNSDIHIHPTPFYPSLPLPQHQHQHQHQPHLLHHSSPLQFLAGTAATPFSLPSMNHVNHAPPLPVPPLTHENDIVSEGVNDVNASTSNDESNSNSTQSNHHKSSHDHSTATAVNASTPQHQPFPLYNPDDRLQNHALNAFQSPFQMQPPLSTADDTKNANNNNGNNNSSNAFAQYFMQSPFMAHPNYAPPPPLPPSHNTHAASFASAALPHEHENGHGHHANTHTEPKHEHSQSHSHHNRLGWQFALLPQQMSAMNPMFAGAGSGASTYLPASSDYMRRDGEQGMVDVPHAHALHNHDQPQQHQQHLHFNTIVSTPISLHQHMHGGSHHHSTHIEVGDMVDVPPDITAKEKRTTKRRRKRSEHQETATATATSVEDGAAAAATNSQKRKRRKPRTSSSSSSSVAAAVAALKTRAQDTENAVKGGAGNGYRMVLEEPVNKSMLSCHQCKNKKTLDRIIVCGHVYRINNTVKTCTKKYCKSCLLRFYLEAPPTDNKDPQWSAWKCPCCRYICCCAWCRKKKAKRLETVSKSIRAEAHRLTPAISLARKLVSESRVNGQSNNPSNNSNHNHNKTTATQSQQHRKRKNSFIDDDGDDDDM